MFARLGRTVVAHPWRVIAVWVVVAVGLVVFSPKLGDIVSSREFVEMPFVGPSRQQKDDERAHEKHDAVDSDPDIENSEHTDDNQQTDCQQAILIAAAIQPKTLGHRNGS